MSGRYVPTGATADGGIGSVFFCTDRNLDRTVAVKFVQRGGEHRRLLDELETLQRVRSKHVVQVFDVAYFNPGSRMGIVEEFIDGPGLDTLMGKVAPDNSLLKMIYQMSTGLADIHAVGIVHRDIKPSNILIDKEGILKIIDFNLSRPQADAHTQGFVGTRGYAAPELYSNGQVNFDSKVDIYALGVTVWTLLYGTPLPDPLRNIPPDPTKWNAEGGGFLTAGLTLDHALLGMLDRCIRVQPRDRPTAAELSQRAGRVLLRGKHRALFVNEAGNSLELYAGKPRVILKDDALGSVTVEYDGLDFRVATVTGEVWVNNMNLTTGASLPNCCVIALGGPQRSANDRKFITMDVSHPEVVL